MAFIGQPFWIPNHSHLALYLLPNVQGQDYTNFSKLCTRTMTFVYGRKRVGCGWKRNLLSLAWWVQIGTIGYVVTSLE
jgi:hypothetical protein